MISLYDSNEINFNNNGLVVLSDGISCIIEEELNGMFEYNLEHPLDKRGKWKQLLEGNIIKCDGQLFRIYRKIKTSYGIKINARHIYYDLLDNFLEDVRPTNLSGSGALAWVLAHTQYSHPFTSMGDVGGSNTQYFARKNPCEAIKEIINNWGGELVRDNFTIKLLQARGLDRGTLVSYGKNIEGIEETLDMDGMCTRMMPYGANGLMLPEKYIDSQYINNYPHPIIKIVEFNDIGIDEENGITEVMALEQLRAAGQNYFIDSKCDIPKFNYKIDFLELSRTEEYKGFAVLERVYLGDTVTIKHSKLDINLKAKVIKTTKNVLTRRIEKIELGSFKENIATSINKSIQEVKKEIVQVTSAYKKAIDNATDLITGSKGGNVVIRRSEDGKPYEILIMDTDNIMTAENVWRWNLGGFGHSSSGIEGPFDVAITMDGSIVGKFITALEIKGEQITGGTITGALLKTSDTESFVTVENQNVNLYSANKMQMKIGIDETWVGEKYPQIMFGPDCGQILTTKNYIRYGQGEIEGQSGGSLSVNAAQRLYLLADKEVVVNAPEIYINSPSVNIFGGNIINLPNGCYLECLQGRIILHSDSDNYLSIGYGQMKIYENGVGRLI